MTNSNYGSFFSSTHCAPLILQGQYPSTETLKRARGPFFSFFCSLRDYDLDFSREKEGRGKEGDDQERTEGRRKGRALDRLSVAPQVWTRGVRRRKYKSIVETRLAGNKWPLSLDLSPRARVSSRSRLSRFTKQCRKKDVKPSV